MTGAPGSVLVVGSVNADLVIGVDRRPAAGETVLGSDLATYPGGKGANQAVAAARLGAQAALVGRVGSDSFGGFLRSVLADEGVGTRHLMTEPGPCGVALITVGPDGDNSIIVSPGANGRLTAADVEAAWPSFETASIVSAQLEVPVAAVMAAVGLAESAGARFVLNLSPPAEVPTELLAAADPLVVNEHEAAFLLGGLPGDQPGDGKSAECWADRQAAALLTRGPRSVVITLGAAGAYIADADGAVHVPSPKVPVIDSTGAGDAFTGALAWRLSVGDTLADAAAFAARVGAAAVTGRGAQSSYPTLDQVTRT